MPEDADPAGGRDSPDPGAPVGRRVFFGLVGLGAAAVVAGGPLSHKLSDLQRWLAVRDSTGLSSLLPGGGWRYYSVTGGFPSVDHATYRLAVSGLVDHRVTFSLADLRGLPRTSLVRDFQCVTGWRVPDVHWSGVALSHLLDAAGLRSNADAVQFVSFDGAYTESLTMAEAMRSDVIVADTMDGMPVSRIHGGPVRMFVAPMYGYKSCKWLAEIRATRQVIPGYWEHYGYDQNGWVGRSNGRHDPAT